jgi:hypothetical protein
MRGALDHHRASIVRPPQRTQIALASRGHCRRTEFRRQSESKQDSFRPMLRVLKVLFSCCCSPVGVGALFACIIVLLCTPLDGVEAGTFLFRYLKKLD